MIRCYRAMAYLLLCTLFAQTTCWAHEPPKPWPDNVRQNDVAPSDGAQNAISKDASGKYFLQIMQAFDNLDDNSKKREALRLADETINALNILRYGLKSESTSLFMKIHAIGSPGRAPELTQLFTAADYRGAILAFEAQSFLRSTILINALSIAKKRHPQSTDMLINTLLFLGVGMLLALAGKATVDALHREFSIVMLIAIYFIACLAAVGLFAEPINTQITKFKNLNDIEKIFWNRLIVAGFAVPKKNRHQWLSAEIERSIEFRKQNLFTSHDQPTTPPAQPQESNAEKVRVTATNNPSLRINDAPATADQDDSAESPNCEDHFSSTRIR